MPRPSSPEQAIQSMLAQRAIDQTPCPVCGGDRLRPDFTASGTCHAALTREGNDGPR